MGWNYYPAFPGPVNASSTPWDAFRYAEANWPYVKMAAIWMFRLPAPDKSHMDYFTLVTPEFRPETDLHGNPDLHARGEMSFRFQVSSCRLQVAGTGSGSSPEFL